MPSRMESRSLRDDHAQRGGFHRSMMHDPMRGVSPRDGAGRSRSIADPCGPQARAAWSDGRRTRPVRLSEDRLDPTDASPPAGAGAAVSSRWTLVGVACSSRRTRSHRREPGRGPVPQLSAHRVPHPVGRSSSPARTLGCGPRSPCPIALSRARGRSPWSA